MYKTMSINCYISGKSDIFRFSRFNWIGKEMGKLCWKSSKVFKTKSRIWSC